MLLEDLSRLGSYSVWEADFELHDQVSSLVGGLGEGQPFPAQSLHCAWLDDVVAGQRDHPPVDGGNVHGAAAQGLRGEGGRRCQPGCQPHSTQGCTQRDPRPAPHPQRRGTEAPREAGSPLPIPCSSQRTLPASARRLAATGQPKFSPSLPNLGAQQGKGGGAAKNPAELIGCLCGSSAVTLRSPGVIYSTACAPLPRPKPPEGYAGTGHGTALSWKLGPRGAAPHRQALLRRRVGLLHCANAPRLFLYLGGPRRKQERDGSPKPQAWGEWVQHALHPRCRDLHAATSPPTAKPGAGFPGCHPHPHPHPGAGSCLLQKPAAAASRPALASHVMRECSKKILVSLNNSDSSAVHVGSSVSRLSARREAAADGGLRSDTSGRGGFAGAGPVLHAKHLSPWDGAWRSRPACPQKTPCKGSGGGCSAASSPGKASSATATRGSSSSSPSSPLTPWLEADGCCFCCGARAWHRSQRRATHAGLGSRAQVS